MSYSFRNSQHSVVTRVSNILQLDSIRLETILLRVSVLSLYIDMCMFLLHYTIYRKVHKS